VRARQALHIWHGLFISLHSASCSRLVRDFDSLTDGQRHDQHGKPVAFKLRSCRRKI
jgi:hypothetical protein